MKSCLLCPRGTKCRGYILHLLIVKLYDAMEQRKPVDEIVRRLSREDMEVLASHGTAARQTCWSRGFVLTVARKLADFVGRGNQKTDVELRLAVERMIVQLDGLFSKLPKGISIDLSELAMEVFNEATRILETEGSGAVVPASIVGQACHTVARKKAGL